jgi:hypothetical protein
MAVNAATLNADIATLLSAPRIGAYLAAAPGGDLASALGPYRWNLCVSAAFYESIHYLEVALRNTIDVALVGWCQTNHADKNPWYRCPAVPLSAEAQTRIHQAVGFATMSGGRQAAGDLQPRRFHRLPGPRRLLGRRRGLDLGGIPLVNDRRPERRRLRPRLLGLGHRRLLRLGP